MTALFHVVEPGLLTTLQDLGRPAHRSAGVPAGGGMDRFAVSAANLLVGNAENTGVLECTIRGPRIDVLADCLVAVTGGDLEFRVNDGQAPLWAAVRLRAGDTVSLSQRRSGARAYLAVGGGFAGDRWLGSVSTYVAAGRGGIAGRPLQVGDVLESATAPAGGAPALSLAPDLRPCYSAEPVLAAVVGPHDSRLARTSRTALLKERWTLTPNSDRMGFRLEGPELEMKTGELLSFGTTFGCLQVTPSGPILLMADHQTSGGYPVAACVARASLPLAAQLAPGDSLTLRPVKVEQAHREWERLRSGLESLRA